MIYYLCMDDNTPSGGRRVAYHHVDILNEAGIPAAIMHHSPDFRLTWFENDTAVVNATDTMITPEDYLVVPESRGKELINFNIPRLVIFNQNAHYTFAGYDGREQTTPYHQDNLKGVMCVSEHNKELLEYTFPFLTVDRVCVSIDTDLFTYSDEKEKLIAYMPRRGANDIGQVLQVLKWRGVLDGWRVVPIDGLTHAEVAAVLKRAAIFLASGYQEGCPLPPLEAAACGCLVVGYDGYGGGEYWNEIGGDKVVSGDVFTFARYIEDTIEEINKRGHKELADILGTKTHAGIARATYSPESERDSVLAFWQQFDQPKWDEYRHYWEAVTNGRNVDAITTHMSQDEYNEYYIPILDVILRDFDTEHNTVYDVGCGGGMIIESLQKRFPELDYVGYDINPNMIETGRRKHPDYEWRLMDEFKLVPFSDLLLCHSVFTHIYEEDADAYLDEILRGISPTHGRASISIHHDKADKDNVFVGNIGRCDYYPPYFEEKLKAHGFRVIDWIDGDLPHGPQRYYVVEVA